MSMILVVEPDPAFAERITVALEPRGLSISVVGDRQAALEHATVYSPRLLLVDVDVPEAGELLSAFAAHRGGPGAIALVPAWVSGSPADYQADAIITKPFSDDDLRDTVTRHLEQARPLTEPELTPEIAALAAEPARRPETAPSETAPSETGPFETGPIETAPSESKPSETGPSQTGPSQTGPFETASSGTAPSGTGPFETGPIETEPTPGGTVESVKRRAARASSPPRIDDEMERKLEETLSGVLPYKKAPRPEARPEPAPAPPKTRSETFHPSDDEIDLLLDRTLGGLVPPRRRRRSESAGPAEPDESVGSTGSDKPVEPIEPIEPTGQAELAELAETTGQAELAELAELAEAIARTEPIEPAVETGGLDELYELGDDERTAALELREVVFDVPSLPELPDVSASAPAVDGDDVFATQAMPQLSGEVRTFGEYTLLERIAVGGMAEVWKARRRGVEGFQKTVAIKRILAHLTASPDFVTMFIDEAKLAAQLNHANIIQIYDLGKVGEDFFIAMEYVDGMDLRSILRATHDYELPLPPGMAMMVAASVARALDYAHRKRGFDNRELGLVHRDVSPQNVMISYEGEIKLCDFGIAKAVAKASTTLMGALKGKLQYMSPEQARGETVDARSDVFSLGSVLYEMLTGHKLFTGDSEIAVLDAVRECEIPALESVEIPADLVPIVQRALARLPEDRYATAGEMEQELSAVLEAQRPAPSPAEIAAYLERLAAVSGKRLMPPPEEPLAEPLPPTFPALAERPAAEIELEPRTPAEPPAADAAAAPEAASPETGSASDELERAATEEAEAHERVAKTRRRWRLAVLAVIVVLALLAAIWWLTRDSSGVAPRPVSTLPAGIGEPAAPAPSTSDPRPGLSPASAASILAGPI